jgi:hypothetical protein
MFHGSVFLDEPCQAGDAFPDAFLGHVGEIEAHGVAAAAVGVERFTGNVGHFSGDALREKRLGVDSLGETEPEKKSALGKGKETVLPRVSLIASAMQFLLAL